MNHLVYKMLEMKMSGSSLNFANSQKCNDATFVAAKSLSGKYPPEQKQTKK